MDDEKGRSIAVDFRIEERTVIVIMGRRSSEMIGLIHDHMAHRHRADLIVLDEAQFMESEFFSSMDREIMSRPALELRAMREMEAIPVYDPVLLAPRKGPEQDEKQQRRVLEGRGHKRRRR